MDIFDIIDNLPDERQVNIEPTQQKNKKKSVVGEMLSGKWKEAHEPLFTKRKETGDDKYVPPGMVQQVLLGSKGAKQAQSIEELGMESLSKITDTAKKALSLVADILRSKVETKSSVIATLLGVKKAGAEQGKEATPNLNQPIVGGR